MFHPSGEGWPSVFVQATNVAVKVAVRSLGAWKGPLKVSKFVVIGLEFSLSTIKIGVVNFEQ